jgi:hypothetical protein
MTRLCRICNSDGLDLPIELREAMFGTGETFQYERCSNCGCLQIAEPPADIGRYYPACYYFLCSGGRRSDSDNQTESSQSVVPAWPRLAVRRSRLVGVRSKKIDPGYGRFSIGAPRPTTSWSSPICSKARAGIESSGQGRLHSRSRAKSLSWERTPHVDPCHPTRN